MSFETIHKQFKCENDDYICESLKTLPCHKFYIFLRDQVIKLLGNWVSSQDHSKQFVKQQINRKIKWRIHQSHNTRFTWKTPNPEKNHCRCQKDNQRKIFTMWKIIITTLSEIIFSHPSLKYTQNSHFKSNYM